MNTEFGCDFSEFGARGGSSGNVRSKSNPRGPHPSSKQGKAVRRARVARQYGR